MFSLKALPSPAVLLALGIILATYVFLHGLLHFTQDSKEPPAVLKGVPFVTSVLGMMRWSMDFYPQMRKRFPALPIYTLRIPGARIYAINSLDLIAVVQRHWRILLFPPIQIKAAKVGMGASDEALRILEEDMITENGFVHGMIKATHPTMSDGPALRSLNTTTFQVFNDALNRLKAPRTVSVKLYEWIDDLIMRATTDAIYGRENPMRLAHNVEAWRNYHPALMFMMLDILPQNLFFKRAVEGRENLVKSFSKYYADGSYEEGSDYIKQFVQHCIRQRIPLDDIPRLLMGTVFNNVANTIPSAFWVVFRIFSNPEVLEDCRNEVGQAVEYQGNIAELNLDYVVNSCPILLSTFQEVFRFHGMANSVRVVSEDMLLDDKYLLKKGGLVMMSARAQHTNSAIWGDDFDQFHHKRFLKKGPEKNAKVPQAAYRGFGGGTTLCPGRHFATASILMLAALMMMRFDVRTTGARWTAPSVVNSSQAEAVEQPDEDIEVEIRSRPEVDNREWRIIFSKGMTT
ncbi:hypothetical protein HIM_09928 [Hirsutella minnesotensis 3608]|uniref:Cytochrome P450 n=1 Tax=Hirsutella minnesotensis 3608 TaxID=1043627 RepID=A0A0F7ZS37_9HYPO|nr:hypothetical protein HIM_09928 [Hirsutella minnesotensis 3608]